MGGPDKTLAFLGGLPVAAHSLRTFAACPAIDAIILVSQVQNHAALLELAAQYGGGKVTAVVPGGERRQDSVAAGLRQVGDVDLVAVHDAARPLVRRETIEQGLALAAQHGAAVPGTPVRDTVKEVDADGRVRRSLDRRDLWAVQTPQLFRRALLLRAHAAAAKEVTDDAMLIEALGEPVLIYDNPTPNPKLTTADDLAVAEALLATRTASTTAAP